MKKHLIAAALCACTATPAMATPNDGFFGGDFLGGGGNSGFRPTFMQVALNQMAGGFSQGGGLFDGFGGFGSGFGGGLGSSFGDGFGQFEGFRGSFSDGFGQFEGFRASFSDGFGRFEGFRGSFGGGFGQSEGFGGSFDNFFGDSDFDFPLNGSLSIVTAFLESRSELGFGDGAFFGAFASFGGNFNPNVTPPVASPVPVPAAVWLLGSGLVGLVGIARRKRNKL